MPDMLRTQTPDDRHYYSLDLPPNPLAPRAARALAVSALAQWDALMLADDVELVVSELVTNSRAPRGALPYPRRSREELEGRFLGLMAYLDP